ncbi:hypothetical protein ACFY05_28460 [Microtetraspora fusca]|uniref:Transposase n=1 Tax=Microtetraspora fusca TaxID=1997 RepID=A0ABW6VBU6_MICFU
MKWKTASAKYRQDIARALTAATPAMPADGNGKPDDLTLRTAMRRCVCCRPSGRDRHVKGQRS